jgi:hypothetical protein
MPRQAKLFEQTKGSPIRALGRVINLPPNWIDRARKSRKSREADLAESIRKVETLRRERPRATATIKAAEAELKLLLRDWELSYRKETFYNGVRILLELSRDGESERCDPPSKSAAPVARTAPGPHANRSGALAQPHRRG